MSAGHWFRCAGCGASWRDVRRSCPNCHRLASVATREFPAVEKEDDADLALAIVNGLLATVMLSSAVAGGALVLAAGPLRVALVGALLTIAAVAAAGFFAVEAVRSVRDRRR